MFKKTLCSQLPMSYITRKHYEFIVHMDFFVYTEALTQDLEFHPDLCICLADISLGALLMI